MAEDVICLLDQLGWTEERELNVIGISMGGMIAQGLHLFLDLRHGRLLITDFSQNSPIVFLSAFVHSSSL